MIRNLAKRLIAPFRRWYEGCPPEWKDDRYCTVCEGRIWPWQTGTRIYSLGMTRSHLNCAASYLKSELEAQNRRVICGGWNGT